jgi:hypothetical protein
MHRLKGYPTWFHASLLAVLGALLATGLLLIPSMLEMRLDWPSPVRLAGDARQTSAIAHSIAGFLTAAALGSLATLHARIGWRSRRSRTSGLLMLCLFAVLLCTAVAIYYVGDPDWGGYSSLAHAAAGLAGAMVFVGHLVSSRRQRRDDQQSTRAVHAALTHERLSGHHPGAGTQAAARKRAAPRRRHLADAPSSERLHRTN